MDTTNIDERQLRKLVSQLDDLVRGLESIRMGDSTTTQLRYLADGIAAALGGRG